MCEESWVTLGDQDRQLLEYKDGSDGVLRRAHKSGGSIFKEVKGKVDYERQHPISP